MSAKLVAHCTAQGHMHGERANEADGRCVQYLDFFCTVRTAGARRCALAATFVVKSDTGQCERIRLNRNALADRCRRRPGCKERQRRHRHRDARSAVSGQDTYERAARTRRLAGA